MNVAGIIIEYNPMHNGHLHLLRETRRLLGQECAVICIMSGDFVQRGDFALLRRQARARAALESDVDLVLELPLPWATASAEGFARGAVETLAATNLCTHLVFGSECGDAQALMTLAAALESPEFPALLRQELKAGDSFAAARERALGRLVTPELAALVQSPNNILGIEYCRAIVKSGAPMIPLSIPRVGAAHDAPSAEGGIASASMIRALMKAGKRAEAIALMSPAMQMVYREEEKKGRAPVFAETLERTILYRLRSMTREEFAALDEGGEGLYNRLYEASRTAVSLEEVLSRAKTKRYAYARLRRMVLWAYLGISPGALPEHPLYLRPLGANAVGRHLLAQMRKNAALPVLTKGAEARRHGGGIERLFTMEAAAADLYSLGYPELSAAGADALWRESLILL